MTDIIKKVEQCGACELHYLEAGAGTRAVILLHGMKFRAETWKDLGTLELIAENGFRALALDLPGFGASPACDQSPDQVLTDFISETKLEKAVLVGPSMGGRVSLEFCLNHSDTLGGLVLLGAVGVKENEAGLSGISQPTLIVWGENDAVSPVSNGYLLRDRIENAYFVEIQGAGHPCYLDAPDFWHDALLQYLASIG